MSVQVYISSVSGSLKIKDQQQRISMVLSSLKIPFTEIDISEGGTDHKEVMRRIVDDPKALPPQICIGDIYCGDFPAFEKAVETETLEAFLRINQTGNQQKNM